jgi:multimeric flavodoxin WrbA
MKVLGLNGSIRKYGNTEILLKQALMGAEAEGAEVEIVKLTDYDIGACRGCGLCLFRENVCQVKDKTGEIFEKINACDGLILGAPCYFLELTAIVKQLIDRCWIMGHNKIGKPKRPASVIVPYATRGWIPYVFVQSNIFFNVLSMTKINQQAVCTQGISEVVLDQDAIDLADRMGREIVYAIRNQDFTYKGEEGICPGCNDKLLRVLSDRKTIECPTCGVRGKLNIIDGKIDVKFEEEAWRDARFNLDTSYNHYTYHIAPSKDYFVRTRNERREKTGIYRDYLVKK